MKIIRSSLLAFIILFTIGCAKKKNEPQYEQLIPVELRERKAKFSGNYNREFNDLNELHIVSAIKNGIDPLETRDDTIHQIKKLVRLPHELELYTSYDITHSIPYLVPSAAKLFVDITQAFRDSLYSKELPLYKLTLTSITRTDDDIMRLTKRNINASDNSAHRYGTTFDVSWKRFHKIDHDDHDELLPERLKLVLAQVLFDLKENERCYIKHERQQACFHITVRE